MTVFFASALIFNLPSEILTAFLVSGFCLTVVGFIIIAYLHQKGKFGLLEYLIRDSQDRWLAKANSEFTFKRNLDILTPEQNTIARIHKKLHLKDSYTISISNPKLRKGIR